MTNFEMARRVELIYSTRMTGALGSLETTAWGSFVRLEGTGREFCIIPPDEPGQDWGVAYQGRIHTGRTLLVATLVALTE